MYDSLKRKLDSTFIDGLLERKILEIDQVGEQDSKGISENARGRISSILSDESTQNVEHLLSTSLLQREATKYDLVNIPDTPETFSLGKESLIGGIQEEDRHACRGRTFFIRTFSYMGYADSKGIFFTPDLARVPVVSEILAKETNFLRKLKEVIQGRMPGTNKVVNELDEEVKSRIQDLKSVTSDQLVGTIPFADIALVRSQGSRERFIEEIFRLRKEFESFREDYRHILLDLQSSVPDDRREATRKMHELFRAAKSDYDLFSQVGVGFGVVVTPMLSLGAVLAGAASANLLVILLSAAAALPLSTLSKLYQESRYVHLVKVLQKLPSDEEMRRILNNLFGELK
jgi:hypothetical protein